MKDLPDYIPYNWQYPLNEHYHASWSVPKYMCKCSGMDPKNSCIAIIVCK